MNLNRVVRSCAAAWVAAVLPTCLAAEPGKADAVRIVLVGDSTVASFPNPPKDRPDLTGWGQVLPEFFDDRVTIVNLARSGASSKSFLALKLWERALAERPDFVLIQFGHNDGPGKGDRETDPKTDFRDNLKRFIAEARAIGAKPVLVTSVARRTFNRQGKITGTLGPHVEATRAVGAEEKVPVVDLNASSTALFNRLGDAGSADFSPSPTDRSHWSRKGARAVAKLVADDLPRAVPELKPYLREAVPAK